MSSNDGVNLLVFLVDEIMTLEKEKVGMIDLVDESVTVSGKVVQLQMQHDKLFWDVKAGNHYLPLVKCQLGACISLNPGRSSRH